MNISELVKLNNLYCEAVRASKENKQKDYEAGVVEGLKRAIEIVEIDSV